MFIVVIFTNKNNLIIYIISIIYISLIQINHELKLPIHSQTKISY